MVNNDPHIMVSFQKSNYYQIKLNLEYIKTFISEEFNFQFDINMSLNNLKYENIFWNKEIRFEMKICFMQIATRKTNQNNLNGFT
ncbi:unnamed protein product [Paramecium octaurelia]|uniref:Uncharacterized protein n=1 Tax=Paramecium octaurelia TaxID=43137 RepID=A0A8S1SI04_PAROT|nr:unnamed protein product [Paramecium octaurelia]